MRQFLVNLAPVMSSPRKSPNSTERPPQPRAKPASRYRQVIAGVLGAAMLLAAGSWLVWRAHPAKPAVVLANSDYVDPSVCATCHDDIAATYRKTGMGRSFSRPTAQNRIEDYSRRNRLDHPLSG